MVAVSVEPLGLIATMKVNLDVPSTPPLLVICVSPANLWPPLNQLNISFKIPAV